MSAEELTEYLESWFPRGAAWEKDNVGLQIGSRGNRIKNIMICLELTDEVLKDAINKNCNFIFTHHPLLFNPVKKLDFHSNQTSQLIEKIIKHDITVYSAHTNLDFVKDGVSFELAKRLKLKNICFLKNQEANQFKVVVFVPENYLEQVSNAAFSAGAGIIGEYSSCSFRIKGEGTFKGSEKTNPAIGSKNVFEKVEEIRLEFIVDEWNLSNVISAILKVHPYEEPAYDIYHVKNKNVNYGAGAIGYLENKMDENEFLYHISKSLNTEAIKYCNGKNRVINKVAVCGGSGASLIDDAINSGADAFITADIKYHEFHSANNRIMLIDAGHYETEVLILDAVKKKIENFIGKKSNLKVYKYNKSTNPIKFYKH
ncbi:Nif3-like dinuclear metal center hexameric protein [Rosettibacter firmus]|uniref:Nif3-like dinuclear metal center hexameric protein n=1 Tax=Rosettibacter firmus TaxID=3111522 RepID=UPI00336BF9FE